jgi:hypothetical protein
LAVCFISEHPDKTSVTTTKVTKISDATRFRNGRVWYDAVLISGTPEKRNQSQRWFFVAGIGLRAGDDETQRLTPLP